MKILLAIAATMIALSGAAANAGTISVTAQGQAQSAVVTYADLDLTSAAGMATLTRRVHSAALAVCGGSENAELAVRYANQACRTKAQAAALKTVADRSAPTVYASR